MEESNLGFCKFCDQSQIIETVGELTQEERDEIATEKCTCAGAMEEKRRKLRREKIDAYIEKHFSAELKSMVNEIVHQVSCMEIEKATIKYDGKQADIWTDSDAYLHIKVKKVEDEELKV